MLLCLRRFILQMLPWVLFEQSEGLNKQTISHQPCELNFVQDHLLSMEEGAKLGFSQPKSVQNSLHSSSILKRLSICPEDTLLNTIFCLTLTIAPQPHPLFCLKGIGTFNNFSNSIHSGSLMHHMFLLWNIPANTSCLSEMKWPGMKSLWHETKLHKGNVPMSHQLSFL